MLASALFANPKQAIAIPASPVPNFFSAPRRVMDWAIPLASSSNLSFITFLSWFAVSYSILYYRKSALGLQKMLRFFAVRQKTASKDETNNVRSEASKSNRAAGKLTHSERAAHSRLPVLRTAGRFGAAQCPAGEIACRLIRSGFGRFRGVLRYFSDFSNSSNLFFQSAACSCRFVASYSCTNRWRASLRRGSPFLRRTLASRCFIPS